MIARCRFEGAGHATTGEAQGATMTSGVPDDASTVRRDAIETMPHRPALAARPGTFTLAEFECLIARLRERDYRFARFSDAEAMRAAGTPFVLMRHDIDMSLEAALAMARREAELDVRATYFLLVRTDHYNLFSRQGTDVVTEILALGHHLGLHFDCDAYPADLDSGELAAACAREAAMLAEWFDRPVDIVSYHRPNERVLSGDPTISTPLPHTYMADFREHIRYVSDSGGRWGHGKPTVLPEFERGHPLHILTHPVWWGERQASVDETLFAVLREKSAELERSFAYNCKAFRSANRPPTLRAAGYADRSCQQEDEQPPKQP
jgi:hypothetical protein